MFLGRCVVAMWYCNRQGATRLGGAHKSIPDFFNCSLINMALQQNLRANWVVVDPQVYDTSFIGAKAEGFFGGEFRLVVEPVDSRARKAVLWPGTRSVAGGGGDAACERLHRFDTRAQGSGALAVEGPSGPKRGIDTPRRTGCGWPLGASWR